MLETGTGDEVVGLPWLLGVGIEGKLELNSVVI